MALDILLNFPIHAISGSSQQRLRWDIRRQLAGVQDTLSRYPLRECPVEDLCYVSIILHDLAMLPEMIQAGMAYLHQSGVQASQVKDVQLELSRHYFLRACADEYQQLTLQLKDMSPEQAYQHFSDWVDTVNLDWPGEIGKWLSSGEIDILMLMTMLSLLTVQTKDRSRDYMRDHYDQSLIAIASRVQEWQRHDLPV